MHNSNQIIGMPRILMMLTLVSITVLGLGIMVYVDDGKSILELVWAQVIPMVDVIIPLGNSGFIENAVDIETFEIDGKTYAAVIDPNNHRILLLNISNPSSIITAGFASDDNTRVLADPRYIDIFKTGGKTYAAVTSDNDHGVQLLDISTPSSITAVGSISDNGTLVLKNPRGLDIFNGTDGKIYAAVTAVIDDGVQILDISNPMNITAAGNITDSTTAPELNGAISIDTFETGGKMYAAVTAVDDDGVQLLDISTPSSITAAGFITDNGTLVLQSPIDIGTFKTGGKTYAAVTSRDEDGVQILDISDPMKIVAAGNITDSTTAPKLDGAAGMDIFKTGGKTYVAVAANSDNGVQILDISNPPTITAAGSIDDDNTVKLDGARDIDTFVIGKTTYAAVLSGDNDNAVQILRLTNQAPTANAGPDQTVNEGTVVNLNGSDSSDPDGDPLTYRWVDAGSRTSVTLSNYTAKNPTFTAPEVDRTNGSVNLALFVHDGTVESAAADNVYIQIRNVNKAPIANAGPDQLNVRNNTLVTLDGSGSSDPDNDVLTYTWSQTGGSPTVSLNSPTAEMPTFTAPNVTSTQTFVFSLTVNDGTVNSTAADTVTITVKNAVTNQDPTVTVGNTQNVREGDTVTLSGSGSDPDGDTLSYSWARTDGLTSVRLNSTNTASASFTAPDVGRQGGFIVFTFTVSDTNGGSDAADVRVNIANVNQRPIADVGSFSDTANEGDTITLDASGSSDPDGDTLTYQWIDGGNVTPIFDYTSPNPTFRIPEIDRPTRNLFFDLVVSDGVLSSNNTAEVDILVYNVNKIPIVSAGSSQTVEEGVTVRLSGTAIDPDGDTMTYVWTHQGGPLVGTITNANALSASFVAPDVATTQIVVMRLTATDNEGSAFADVSITVTDASAPTPPITTPPITTPPVSIPSNTDSTPRTTSKGGSSSNPPVINIKSVISSYSDSVPQEIKDIVESYDSKTTITPINTNDENFDFPLVINNQGYLIAGNTNTLEPQTLQTNEEVTISFTVYDRIQLSHFTMYFNLDATHDRYWNSDTYVRYDKTGVTIGDPHDIIGNATATINTDDTNKQIVTFNITFEDSIPTTDVIINMWNTDTSRTLLHIFDVFKVVDSDMMDLAPDTEPDTAPDTEPDTEPDTAPDTESPSIISESAYTRDESDFSDYEINVLKMWGGYHSDYINDEEFLNAFGFDGVDIPDYFMDTAIWFIQGDLDRQNLINALEHFDSVGLLTN